MTLADLNKRAEQAGLDPEITDVEVLLDRQRFSIDPAQLTLWNCDRPRIEIEARCQ